MNSITAQDGFCLLQLHNVLQSLRIFQNSTEFPYILPNEPPYIADPRRLQRECSGRFVTCDESDGRGSRTEMERAECACVAGLLGRYFQAGIQHMQFLGSAPI
jgi:hypothetical protein